MKYEDLPPDASPELRALLKTDEKHVNFAMFFTNEVIELRAMLQILLDLQTNLLVQGGFNADALKAKDDALSHEYRATFQTLLLSRLDDAMGQTSSDTPPARTGE